MSASTPGTLLAVRDLATSFATRAGVVQAVDGVSLDIARGETLALVGESGSGKSVTALSIARLVPVPGRIERGSVRLDGRELRTLPEREMRAVRGREIGFVFQEPSSALDPLMRIGRQIVEPLVVHLGLEASRARERARALLVEVGFAEPERALDAYPHELSGGMRQRAWIAAAIACGPALLLADEPTTALDVTLQAGVLALLRDLGRTNAMGLLLVTHDLALVAENADRAAVMYAGRIVEEAPAARLLAAPRHPYTALLLRSRPGLAARVRDRADSTTTRASAAGSPSAPADASLLSSAVTAPSTRLAEPRRRSRLAAIPGAPPSAFERPSGCRFRTRCPLARELCASVEPELVRVDDGTAIVGELPRTTPASDSAGVHRSACHFADEVVGL